MPLGVALKTIPYSLWRTCYLNHGAKMHADPMLTIVLDSFWRLNAASVSRCPPTKAKRARLSLRLPIGI